MRRKWSFLLVGLLLAACTAPMRGAISQNGLPEPTVEITALPSISFAPTPSPTPQPTTEPISTPTPTPSPAPEPFSGVMTGYESITEKDISSVVDNIAGKSIHTRWCGTSGSITAAKYIVEYFADSGVKAIGRTYWQKFSYNGRTCRNIVGIIRGTEEKELGYVLIMAHYDSVIEGPGADDNASGVSAVLEIAQAYGVMAKQGIQPRRSIVFILFDAEEAYLKGSQYFVSHSTVPFDKIYTAINMDMIGRNAEDKIYYYGVPNYKEFAERRPELWTALNEANKLAGMELTTPPSSSKSFWRTDQWPFYEAGMHRVLLLNSGKHDEYHTSRDTLNKLNYVKIRNVAQLVFLVSWQLAGMEK